MCRYHGWSYERDGGGLRNVPYEDSFEPIDHAHHGLQRFRTEARHGLIFVDLSNHASRTLADWFGADVDARIAPWRSEEHTSELQSLMRTSYAVLCLKKKKQYSRHI